MVLVPFTISSTLAFILWRLLIETERPNRLHGLIALETSARSPAATSLVKVAPQQQSPVFQPVIRRTSALFEPMNCGLPITVQQNFNYENAVIIAV